MSMLGRNAFLYNYRINATGKFANRTSSWVLHKDDQYRTAQFETEDGQTHALKEDEVTKL